ncbi:MAG: dihydrodipicolinate reductase, partial [Boseongicola sp.]|nr:dihydrodipicolinate reductase [Boseongicola sp.]
MFYRMAILASLLAVIASPTLADGFMRVSDRENFMSLVQDRQLKRFGIKLQVSDQGQISGRAFG